MCYLVYPTPIHAILAIMHYLRRHPRKSAVIIAAILLLIATMVVFSRRANAPEAPDEVQSTTQETDETDGQPEVEPEPENPSFDRARYSLDNPTSPWVIVNKQRPLPDGFVPPDLIVPNVRLRLAASEQQMQLSAAAQPALEQMFAAAAEDGVTLVFGSGYRSEALQRQFYESYVARDGQAAADRYSARPGTSEHQTGLAVDITSVGGRCHLEVCFEDLPEGQWLAANAHRYGFIIRYPDGKESITGYQYEPWHMRYVGTELSAEINRTGLTLEEFFGL
jgi:zinc D-Ala-D-Ala carboxypeptidase